MLLEQEVRMTWNNRNRDWYESKGYIFTKYRDTFYVSVFDLPRMTNIKVEVKCDYCGKSNWKNFSDYNISLEKSIVKRDCCKKCEKRKLKETLILLYGVDHQSKIPEVNKKIADSQKLDLDFVRDQFESCNYEMVSAYYKNAKTPLEFICNKHREQGVQKLDYSNFKQGRRCKYCTIDLNRIKIKDRYRKVVEDKEFIFVDVIFNGYSSEKIKLEVICKLHIEEGSQFVNPTNFERQCGCKYCGREKQGVSKRNKIVDIEQVFKDRDYNILNSKEYKNNKTKLYYICNMHPELGIQETDFANVRRAKTCKSCIYKNITGENHYLWKGGVSPIHNFLRCKISNWKKDSLKKYGYKCDITGEKKKLVVHHLYSFDQILDETMIDLSYTYKKIGEYTSQELQKIEELFLRKHDSYGLGIPLTTEIHNLFHSVYNKGKNTKEQYEEFKQRYLNGEFEL